MMSCSEEAFAKCPTSHLCGSLTDATFMEDSECAAFNQKVDASYIRAGVIQQWIPVTERLPENFVSVLGYMTDAGDFPPVRECYTVGNAFFFPALSDVHPVSHWMPLPEPPKEGTNGRSDC